MGVFPYVECDDEEIGFRNTGSTEECLESVTIKTAVAKPGFSFASIADAKSLAKWKLAIAAKDLFPLYDVEELSNANTEDTVFEGRNKTYTTAKGKKVNTYNSFLGLCSHNALTSFDAKELQLFEFTEDGEIKAVVQDETGKIKGQSVTLGIGKRVDAMPDKPPFTPVTVTYKDFKEYENRGALLRPGFTASDVVGIFDVHLKQVLATATRIEFTATTTCAGGSAKNKALIAGDVIVRNLLGAVVTTSFITADPVTGIYALTGTGFATGYTVNLNGVITQVEMIIEAVEPLKITITP